MKTPLTLRSGIIYSVLLLSIVTLPVACLNNETPYTPQAVTAESNLQTIWNSRLLTISGTVVDDNNIALASANVEINGITTNTDQQGQFIFTNVTPENTSLTVSHATFNTEIITLALQQSTDLATIELATIKLSVKPSTQVRFIFGGDVAFGRRFIDPDEITPRNQVPADFADALIQTSDPLPGTRSVLKHIRPWFQQADWAVVNLETPVTDNPSTPHTEKSFAFFTMPGSLPALSWAGIDYVSLGNNHVYDYLDIGLNDTLLNLDNTGLFHSGAGSTPAAAFAAFRQTINGQQYAFISATSVSGSQYDVTFLADSTKGGAADLRNDSAVINSIQTEVAAGYTPIIQWHTGQEYTYTPSSYAAERLSLAATNGAALVISHHPHIAQGVSVENGVVIAEGLGNFAFDQSRLETLLGLVARVDMTAASVDELRLLPIRLKNYSPLPITGDLANRFIRRIASYSNGRGAIVYPFNFQGYVSFDNNLVNTVESTKNISVTLSDQGTAIIDLRRHADSSYSFASFTSSASVNVKIGNDILLFGDFEDWDNDDTTLEAAQWDLSSSSRFVCLSHAFSGTAGLCTLRDSRHSSDTVTSFRNRIRVMGDTLNTPNKNLTLFGYYKAENAGNVSIVAKYYASTGDQTFGEETIYSHLAGNFDWTLFTAPLNMPAADGARAVRFFIHHSPPANGQAVAAFDELALINWQENINSGIAITTPHARDFLLVSGTAGEQISMQLTFNKITPIP